MFKHVCLFFVSLGGFSTEDPRNLPHAIPIGNFNKTIKKRAKQVLLFKISFSISLTHLFVA